MKKNIIKKLNQSFQSNLKSEISTISKDKEKDTNKERKSLKLSKTLFINYIPSKELSEESIAETEDEQITNIKIPNDNTIGNNSNTIKRLVTINSIIMHEDCINNYKVKAPGHSLKDRIVVLEKELFALMNIEYEKEIIYEDFVLVDNNENYYVHLLRTAELDPNKENFLLIHGFLSSSTHFLSILPYLLLKYNVFIPDTIGMGLSSRPQIEFDSPEHCEEYFIEIIYILVKKIFFQKNIILKIIFILVGIPLEDSWLAIIL